MRVLITGLSLFSKRLAADLQAFDPENTYLFFDTYYSRKDLLKFIWNLRKADIVISMNGVTDRSRTLDLVLKFKKKLVLQWMGSDALYAIDRQKNGTLSRDYIDYAWNFVDSPWLLEEVGSIGVKPEVVKFKFFESSEKPVERYEALKVITYLSHNRQVFYGLDWVLQLAADNPDIPFEVYGTDASDKPGTSNISWKGWQEAEVFTKALREAPIFLRLTEHDGFSVSLIEALTSGCEVLTRMPVEYAVVVESPEDMLTKFKAVRQRVMARDLTPDLENARKVKAEFNREKALGGYVARLKALMNEHPKKN